MWMELTPLKMLCSICAEFGRHSIDGVNSPYSTLPHFCVGNLALTEWVELTFLKVLVQFVKAVLMEFPPLKRLCLIYKWIHRYIG